MPAVVRSLSWLEGRLAAKRRAWSTQIYATNASRGPAVVGTICAYVRSQGRRVICLCFYSAHSVVVLVVCMRQLKKHLSENVCGG